MKVGFMILCVGWLVPAEGSPGALVVTGFEVDCA